jgi:outer membrane biosynthesis protein TonB
VQLVNTDSDPGLVAAAVEAARRWVYQPSLLNGQAVAVLTTIDFRFELQP